MGIWGWLINEAEYIKNSWNEKANKAIEVAKYNSVEERLADIPGMTKEEVNQGIKAFNGGSKEDLSIDGAKVETANITGDEPEAIGNWARSVSIEPVMVTNTGLDREGERKEQEEEKERQRNNLMNMALQDPKRIIDADQYKAHFKTSQRSVKQSLEVNGVTSIDGGDLHVRVEENPFRNWNAWDSAAGLGQGLVGYQGCYNDRSSDYKFWWNVGNKSMKTLIEVGPIIEGVPFNPGSAPALQFAAGGGVARVAREVPLVPIYLGGNGSKQQEQNPNASNSKVPSKAERPSWRQSEKDVSTANPDYETQKSFKNGEDVPYGTKGSVRPDNYKEGASIEVKNYNVTTASGRNRLVDNITKQVEQRVENLPADTSQKVVIDVRGQNVSNDVLREIRDSIVSKTGENIEIQFLR